METAKQDCILFFFSSLDFTVSLAAATIMYYHLQSCWFFWYMYLQAIPQGPSLLELREQGQEDNDIGYRKGKKKITTQGLNVPWKACSHCLLNT